MAIKMKFKKDKTIVTRRRSKVTRCWSIVAHSFSHWQWGQRGFFGTWELTGEPTDSQKGARPSTLAVNLATQRRCKAISAEMESGWPSADKSAAADENSAPHLTQFGRVTWHANRQSRPTAV